MTDILNNSSCDQKSVLISWEHDAILKITKALGHPLAPHWSNDRYDRVWILDFEQGKVVKFRDLPQRLFPDDSN